MFWSVIIILIIVWVPIMVYMFRQSWESRGNTPPILRYSSVRTISDRIIIGIPIIVGVMFWKHSDLAAGILASAIIFGFAQIVDIFSYRSAFKQEKDLYNEMSRKGWKMYDSNISDKELNDNLRSELFFTRNDNNYLFSYLSIICSINFFMSKYSKN